MLSSGSESGECAAWMEYESELCWTIQWSPTGQKKQTCIWWFFSENEMYIPAYANSWCLHFEELYSMIFESVVSREKRRKKSKFSHLFLTGIVKRPKPIAFCTLYFSESCVMLASSLNCDFLNIPRLFFFFIFFSFFFFCLPAKPQSNIKVLKYRFAAWFSPWTPGAGDYWRKLTRL